LTLQQKKLLKTWIAAGLWIVLIMIESTSYLSSANTSRFLYPILHFLFGIDYARFEVLHHYLRKTGHFVGYFILSFLLFRSWRATLPLSSRWALRWAAIAFLMSAFVASMDEWHQTFLPSRTGTIHDVILDSIGAMIAQILILVWLQSRNRLKAAEAAVYEPSGLNNKLS
jgi:VanZ family protein